jgi:hypothetical protein
MRSWISCVAILALSFGTASAVVRPEPRGPVHVHYQIVADNAGHYSVRLTNACDVAKLVADDLKRLRAVDRNLNMHMNLLHGVACEPVKAR